jgi:hypothetical protein
VRHSKSSMLALALILSLVLIPCVLAQAKKDLKTGEDRLEGTIQSINKDTSTITLRQANKNNIVWQIVFNKDTKFTFRNEPATVAELKDGIRVICLGKFLDGTKMTAVRIDARTEK